MRFQVARFSDSGLGGVMLACIPLFRPFPSLRRPAPRFLFLSDLHGGDAQLRIRTAVRFRLAVFSAPFGSTDSALLLREVFDRRVMQA